MFSLARALFSPGSAEDRSSLFVWFISNNAGPVNSFWNELLHLLRRAFSFVVYLWPSVDDHGSSIIFRSASVRPTLVQISFSPANLDSILQVQSGSHQSP